MACHENTSNNRGRCAIKSNVKVKSLSEQFSNLTVKVPTHFTSITSLLAFYILCGNAQYIGPYLLLEFFLYWSMLYIHCTTLDISLYFLISNMFIFKWPFLSTKYIFIKRLINITIN